MPNSVYYKGSALRHLDKRLSDLAGPGADRLADDITKLLVEGNTRDRMAGKDRHGVDMTAVQLPRKGKVYGGKDGKPLVPRKLQSRAIAGFKAVARRQGAGHKILAGWQSTVLGSPFILAFHAQAAAIKRDIFGISPQTWVDIRKRVKQFTKSFGTK